MKNYFTLIIAMIVGLMPTYATNPELEILGTWKYDMTEVATFTGTTKYEPKTLITFKKDKTGYVTITNHNVQLYDTHSGSEAFNGFTGELAKFNKKVTLKCEVSAVGNFVWDIDDDDKLATELTISGRYFNNFEVTPIDGNTDITEEDILEMEMALNEAHDKQWFGYGGDFQAAKQLDEVMYNLKGRMHFGIDNTLTVSYVNTDYETVVYDYQIIRQTHSMKRYATIKFIKNNSGEYSDFIYYEDGEIYDPDSTAFLYTHYWDTRGNYINNINGMTGTFYCMAENEGIWSDIVKIKINSDLELKVECFEAENDSQRKVVIECTDSTLVADRYKKINDNHFRIMVNDKVKFRVNKGNDDVTDISELICSYEKYQEKISATHTFKNAGIYYISAKLNDLTTDIATIEVMDLLNFDISPNTIHLGEAATFEAYTRFYNGIDNNNQHHKQIPNNLTIRNLRNKVVGTKNGNYTPSSVGTHKFYAATNKVRSEVNSVTVVPSSMKLTTNQFFCPWLDRYLMPKNKTINFKITLNDKDVTLDSSIKIYDQDNKEVHRNEYMLHPGIYNFVAMNGLNQSNVVTVEVRDRLWLSSDIITPISEQDTAPLTIEIIATQDDKVVTNEFINQRLYRGRLYTYLSHRYYNKRGYTSQHLPIIKLNSDSARLHSNSDTLKIILSEGWHYISATRDSIFKSNTVAYRVENKKVYRPSPEVKLKVDKTIITLGESVTFTTEPDGAKIYEEDTKIKNIHTPQTPGYHFFHARLGKNISEIVIVYVKEHANDPVDKEIEVPEDTEDTEDTKEPEGPTSSTEYSPILCVNKTTIELGEELNFRVDYRGTDCTNIATIKSLTDNTVIGATYKPLTLGKHEFIATIHGKTTKIVTVHVTTNKWVGTYEVSTPQKLVYESDSTVNLIHEVETFKISIDYDGVYRVYGLSKDNPNYDIMAIEVEDNKLAFVGSYFRTKDENIDTGDKDREDTITYKPNWTYIMQVTDSENEAEIGTYKYYTKPLFAMPYIFTINSQGEISCTLSNVMGSSSTGNFIAIDIFDVNNTQKTILHRSTNYPIEYRAGKISIIKKLSSEVDHFEDENAEIKHHSILTLKPVQNYDESLSIGTRDEELPEFGD